MYLSVLDTDKLRELDTMKVVMDMIGCYEDRTYITHPPVCPKCKGYVYIDIEENVVPSYGQCFDCGEMYPIYYNDKLNIRNPWSRNK